jgi:hypothetical protein
MSAIALLRSGKSRPLHHLEKLCSQHSTGTNINHHFSRKFPIYSHRTTYLSTASTSIKTTVHEPPLPIRVALVSSSTALCTPIFPAIGFINVVIRSAIRDKTIRAQLSGSIGSVLSIAFYTIVPYSYQYAPLILPCAIGNGIAAGGAYAALDLVAGGPSSALGSTLLKNPLIAGGAIGAFTGFVAPLYLYGPIYNALYGLEGISEAMYYLTFPHFTGISVTTGFAAGVAMYPLLHYPIYGIPTIPWTALTGAVLMGSTVALFHTYTTSDENVMPLPEGSYVRSKDVPLLDSIIRYNVEQDEFGTYSLTTNEFVGDADEKEKGQIIAESVRKYQTGGWDSASRKYTFDNQVLSVLGNFFDSGVADRFEKNLVKVKDIRELQDFEEMMYRTDWVVKRLMDKTPPELKVKSDAADVEKLIKYGAMSKRERKRRLQNIGSTSIAVELLMLLRLSEKHAQTKTRNFFHNPAEMLSSFFSDRNDPPSIQELEIWIKKRCPNILLYHDEELRYGLKGQSVEAQLERLGWKPSNLDVSLNEWQKMRGEERGKSIVNGLVVTTTILASYFLQL